jgi:hypothetical protein
VLHPTDDTEQRAGWRQAKVVTGALRSWQVVGIES